MTGVEFVEATLSDILSARDTKSRRPGHQLRPLVPWKRFADSNDDERPTWSELAGEARERA
jgi:hypothetical protein